MNTIKIIIFFTILISITCTKINTIIFFIIITIISTKINTIIISNIVTNN